MRNFGLALALAALAACGGSTTGTDSTIPGPVATIVLPGSGPFGAKITPDGRFLFVPLFGTFTPWVVGNTVAVIDTATDQVVAQIVVEDRPEDVDFDGDYAYVTNSTSASVSVIHIPTLAVVATIPLGTYDATYLYGVAIRDHRAWVFSSGGNFDGSDENIFVIDTDPASPTFHQKIQGITLTGLFTRGMFRPGADEIVVPRGAAGNDFSAPPEIAVFDTQTYAFKYSIQILQAPGGFHGLEDLTITPNGRYAYAPFYNFGSGGAEVFVIDLQERRFQDVITLANGDISTHGIEISPDGLLVGVTSWNIGTVSFLFTPTNTVLYEFPTGANPNEIVFTPDGRKAYVTDQNSQTVTVIGLPSTRGILQQTVANGLLSPPAEADLTQALAAMTTGDWATYVANRFLFWASEGLAQVGEPKNMNAEGAALNNFSVAPAGVTAR